MAHVEFFPLLPADKCCHWIIFMHQQTSLSMRQASLGDTRCTLISGCKRPLSYDFGFHDISRLWSQRPSPPFSIAEVIFDDMIGLTNQNNNTGCLWHFCHRKTERFLRTQPLFLHLCNTKGSQHIQLGVRKRDLIYLKKHHRSFGNGSYSITSKLNLMCC